MIALDNASLKIFVALEPCDMRKSINGFFALASTHLEHPRLEYDTVLCSPTSAAPGSSCSIFSCNLNMSLIIYH